MSLLLNLVFKATGSRALVKFRNQCRQPGATQEQLLKHIIRKNQSTAFGQAHQFDQIASFDDFQRRVPISTYEDLKPYIDASLNGEPAQLTVERPVLFATTSGTTGVPKYIPVTPESKSLKSQLTAVWLSALHRDHPIFAVRIQVERIDKERNCGRVAT